MKIVHISDTHLGYSGPDLAPLVEDVDRPGVMVRQRQLDIIAGLRSAVDAAIRAEADVVIHSGDLFDSARPPSHVIDVAMREVKRLLVAGIPAIIVEGNNSFPRDPALGHPLHILRHLDGVRVVCEEPTVVTVGRLAIHAYPYKALSGGQWPQAPPSRADVDAHVLVAHGIADGHPYFRGDRPAQILGVKSVAAWFDYVALGQYNRHAQVPETENAFYSGSSAMVTWADHRPGHLFSAAVVVIDDHTTVATLELPTRVMRSYGLDDAFDYSKQDVLELLASQEDVLPATDANTRVVIDGLAPLVRRELSIRDVEAIFARSSALQVVLHAREERWDAVRSSLEDAGALPDRFESLVLHGDGDAEFKRDVIALGKSILENATQMTLDEDLGDKGARG